MNPESELVVICLHVVPNPFDLNSVGTTDEKFPFLELHFWMTYAFSTAYVPMIRMVICVYINIFFSTKTDLVWVHLLTFTVY